MFVVERVARGHRCLYLVESVREGKVVRQRTIKALGRKEALIASGELHRLAASIARHSERCLILSDIDAGHIAALRIGGPLLFGRLWERLGIGAVLEKILQDRQFGFSVERAVFVATLHRLFVSGSDRSCVDWMKSYAIDGAEELALHHFYRAMAWLGEEIEEAAEGALAPRCVKDVIEETLFERRRDLFTDLSLVFMDTTTLSFTAPAVPTLAGVATPRIIARTWRRWFWLSSSMPRGGRSAPRWCPATPRTSPFSCRSSTGCGNASASPAPASSPTVA